MAEQGKPVLLTEAEAHDRLIAEGYANDNRRQEAIDAMKLLGLIAPEPVDPAFLEAVTEAMCAANGTAGNFHYAVAVELRSRGMVLAALTERDQ